MEWSLLNLMAYQRTKPRKVLHVQQNRASVMLNVVRQLDGLRHRLIALLASVFSAGCLALVPLMPAIMALMLMDRRYIKDYRIHRGKFKVHFLALSKGPVAHYFSDVFLRYKHVPVTVYGECVQCGNCCLNRQCAFLEPIGDDKFQCGIYGRYLRRFSNCGSFPLHAQDIARYECPSYFVEGDPRVAWLKVEK